MANVALSREQLIVRFWSKVNTSGDCWLWTGAQDEHGYGALARKSYGESLAHRFSWSITNGKPAPKGLPIYHTCNNIACVRPAHLSLNTQAANMTDMTVKGRAPRKKKQPTPVLTEALVRIIRARSSFGETSADLARASGLSRQTIQSAIRGYSWKHV